MRKAADKSQEEKEIQSLQLWLESLREMIATETDLDKKAELKEEAEAVVHEIDKSQRTFLTMRKITIHIIPMSEFI